MKISRSNLALIGLGVVFLSVFFLFALSPRLIFLLVTGCQNFFFSCRNALFSFLSSPAFYFWLPLALFSLASFTTLSRLLFSFLFLFRLKKSKKPPLKLAKTIKGLPELEKVEAVSLALQEPLALAAGFKKPRIYLSEGLVKKLNPDELKAVLIHEAAHLKKRHHLKLLLANFLRDLLFFLPLAHQLYRFFALHKEIEADEEAIKKTQSPLALAQALLKVARSHRLLAYSFPHYHSKTSLAVRVKHLTGEEIEKQKTSVFKGLVVSLLILLLLFSSLGFVFPQKHNCSAHCSSNKCCPRQP